MPTALFAPSHNYTGEFATLNYVEERGWQVTLWQWGQPKRYTVHDSIFPAVLEIVQAGFVWANEKVQAIFEEDVIGASK